MDAAALHETRRRFEARRRVAWARWGVSPPSWLGPDDPLMSTYQHQERLFLEGEVVWGCFVQANRALWKPGVHDSPGMVLYGLHPDLDHEAGLLIDLAADLFDLKGTTPDDPDERAFAEVITDELARTLDHPLGPGLWKEPPLFTTTTVVHRVHVPHGHLAARLFPLLVAPEVHASLVLPCEYWSEAILRRWKVQVVGA